MSLPQNISNNFQGQNIMVNQVPVGHIVPQNNGILTNALTHENQIIHNNIVESQPMQGVQTTVQTLPTISQIPVQSVQTAPIATPAPSSVVMKQQSQQVQNTPINATNTVDTSQVVTKQRLQDLVREIDQTLSLEDDVEEILLSYVDEFVDRCLNGAALIAKNRRCNTMEVKDVQQFLTRNYNMWTPGFGTDELRPYKRSLTTDAHKQRLALIRKTLKKY